jgi:hypothetical protein
VGIRENIKIWLVMLTFLLGVASPGLVYGEDWKNQVVFPNDPFCSPGVSASDSGWVKFTIKSEDPCTVYFQDSQLYVLHYDFATSVLDPFIGMSATQYYQVTLYEDGQQAALGTVIMPPITGSEPDFPEYGIQFIRQDAYSREEIVAMFNVVKTCIIADPNIQAFYFPAYEQRAIAEANRDWFEDQGIPISSTSRWAEGNPCYSEGWALGKLKFFSASEINTAYQNGLLEPNDILLTDDVPAEIPYVAGILSLSPSTPSSHVAILAMTYGIPFVHLAVVEDTNRAQQLVGHNIAFSAFDDGFDTYNVRLIDVNGVLTNQQIGEILELKKPPHLDISPIAYCGSYSANTDVLTPSDVNHFGGKGSNFGILRTSIPNNSPVATVLSFDLWNDFLDQPITPREIIVIESGGYKLFWADNDEEQGPTHADFGLSKSGFEDLGLFDIDGTTLIDSIEQFPPQGSDVSYGRNPDGNDNWDYFASGTATPGNSNGSGSATEGLFINEFMADNDGFIQDNFGEYDDWIEIYNAGPNTVNLGGMYLTDNLSDPTEWMIPFGITGSTLREEINNRLSKYTYPPNDMVALSKDLSAIRSLFKDINVTSFTPSQIVAIESILLDSQYGFNINSKLRFRSSTNVEDSEQFTGAGLYSSHSGCLADEFDGDDSGPCLCDPCEVNERGVFRAIRRTLASFYNDNAFLERLRHDVNEAQVGMAVLVHHSFPDEIELGNGVATLDKRGTGANMYITLVTQNGAVSVTNPEGGSIPEEVTVRVYPSGSIGLPILVRSSNLVPLGETVMEWDNDYSDLASLLIEVSDEFSSVTGKTEYVLDLEYKKVAPGGVVIPAGGLVIKQVRQIPQPNDTPSITPFLINEPTEYRIFPGELELMEGTDVFADHRLKSRWTLETKSLWLNEPNLMENFYTQAHIEYLDGDRVRTITGMLPLLPFAYHDFNEVDATDSWRMHHLANPRTYKLQTKNIQTLVSPAENPLLTLRDIGSQPFMLDESRFKVLELHVEYDQPVQSWYQHVWPADPPSGIRATTVNKLCLWRCPQSDPDDVLQQRFYESDGISIETEFYKPPPPQGWGDWTNHTAPLVRWVRTTIEGYTTESIILHGYYSQTYRPEHHNIKEHFLFEPRLEPGISQDILDELQAQDIRLIHLVVDNWGTESSITTHGFKFVPADFDDNGYLNFIDFAVFAEHWLETECGPCGGADLTGNGEVDMDDLQKFAGNWLGGAVQSIPGNLNGDSYVNFMDFSLFAKHWLDITCGACDGADFTGDGNVNMYDLMEFTKNWLTGVE